ncbi:MULTISPECIES: AMP-binding protein [unclassified Streptomyces]|uniref:AMP-binding protein n=1 Tax=unclassified Streptomyces TaxID=2593676 RepID=UPI00344DA3A9
MSGGGTPQAVRRDEETGATAVDLAGGRIPPTNGAEFRRVDAWVSAVCAAAPESIALQDGDRRVTYAELDREADRVARMISARGVAPGGAIGVRMRRGWRLYAALLGVWRHGSAYVPVDLSYPRARQDHIVADSGMGLLVEDGEAEAGFAMRVLDPRPECASLPPHTAYVLYTSGSTGRPKGVVLRHANVLAFLDGAIRTFRFGAMTSGPSSPHRASISAWRRSGFPWSPADGSWSFPKM